jgi:sulfite exporter TauE/SafE
MTGLFIVATSGLIAGSLHVLSGPDHLAAVAPLAADSRRSVWRSGFQWGIGHTGGVVLVGLAILVLRDLLPLERLSSASERIVGVALIGVGLWGIRRAMRTHLHLHAHDHGGHVHTHVHVHGADRGHAPASTSRHDHVHASFLFGVLHGLAGSSHFFGVLPALALPTQVESVTYLAAYGLGTVTAMTAFSSVVGMVGHHARSRAGDVYRALLYACSVAAVLVGGWWLV